MTNEVEQNISGTDEFEEPEFFEFVRSTCHSIKFMNAGKARIYFEFIEEYRRVTKIIVDLIWNLKSLDIKQFDRKTKLNIPSFLIKDEVGKIETTLSGRALKCCSTQACGIVKAACEKPRKRQFVINELRAEHKKVSKKLRRNTRRFRPVKPDVSKVNPEINSICGNLLESQNENNHFDAWLSLSSFFNNKGHGYTIDIPLKDTKLSNKWRKEGEVMKSFLFTKNNINIRWEVKVKKKTEGKIFGADQGKLETLVLGHKDKNGVDTFERTPLVDVHGHTLENIIERMARCKRGSKAFKRLAELRKRFINWALNQLSLIGIKQVNFEDIININFGKNVSRGMLHWCNTLIRDKFYRLCEEHGVHVRTDDSTYGSQRCNECHIVRESQRRKKVYTCTNCGYVGDTESNSSLNRQQNLPSAAVLRGLGYNKSGFFWEETGFYDLNGVELTVPLSKKSGKLAKNNTCIIL